MDLWLKLLGGAVLGSAIFCNLPTSLWLPSQKATLAYLKEASLKKLDKSNEIFKEAQELSSLKAQLNSNNFNLYAVVLENLGVTEFQQYFKGEIFLDINKHFYGPKERWMFLSGFIRPSVWMSIYRAKQKEIDGNLKGEGRLLGGKVCLDWTPVRFPNKGTGVGRDDSYLTVHYSATKLGVFVIGSGDSGVLYEHRESEFGDHANLTSVMEAIKRI